MGKSWRLLTVSFVVFKSPPEYKRKVAKVALVDP